MSDRLETIRTEVGQVIAPLGLGVYDVVLGGGVLRLVLDRPGGVDVDTLEVSSPGLERALRRPEHFARALDSTVTLKLRGDDGAIERLRGQLTSVEDDTVTVRTESGERVVRFDAIESAKTVFEWAPAPKPGKGS